MNLSKMAYNTPYVEQIEYTQSEIILLSEQKTMLLPAGNLIVEVSSGEAWISIEGRDIFVQAGQSVVLEESLSKVLISSSRPRSSVVFRICKR